ncbi:RNA polymerase sigma factor [Pontibacter sp. G13]|uniref:RNA polymerase sigma factor n=1 Tax=Pontibacter sp. G13 TaxID=3074898 RepID=UPI00288AAA65|nr:RNA polymerase sigma factor [Pontibacter sp. G13]WNJ16156.1 RNA polymerase sigma factor [Pontibacter sp. G13]
MRPKINYTEAELAQGCKKGKPVFQRALYQRYHRLMFGVCLRYTDSRDDAQDILQEGFIKVFRHISKFRGDGSLEGWIRRIMVHTSIEHYRKKSRYFMVDIQEAHTHELDADAISNLSHEEILTLVRDLPAGYRTVFSLYVIDGYTHQDIADMLGISVGTSKSQLSRAKRLLQQQLSDLHSQAANF